MYLVYKLRLQLDGHLPERVVIVSSDLHRIATRLRIDDDYNIPAAAYSESQAYASSKLCNVLFSRALAKLVDRLNLCDKRDSRKRDNSDVRAPGRAGGVRSDEAQHLVELVVARLSPVLLLGGGAQRQRGRAQSPQRSTAT